MRKKRNSLQRYSRLDSLKHPVKFVSTVAMGLTTNNDHGGGFSFVEARDVSEWSS